MPLTLVLTWSDSNPGEGCSDPVIVMVSLSILPENRITEKKKSSLEAVAVNHVRDYGPYKTAGGVKGAVFWSRLLDRECERRRSQGWLQGFRDDCSMNQAMTLLGMQQLNKISVSKRYPHPMLITAQKSRLETHPCFRPWMDGRKRGADTRAHYSATGQWIPACS